MSRAAYIAGLRDLAQWLEDNPAAPLPATSLNHCALSSEDRDGIDRVSAAAAVMGVPVEDKDGRVEASRRLGRIKYCVFYNLRAEMDRYYAYTSYRDSVQPEAVP